LVARGGWNRGPRQEVYGRTLTMYGQGQSDRPLVPTKFPNHAGAPAAEGIERRGLTKGNPSPQNALEAERFLAELRERFAQFGLALHPEKTRLLEFGPYAAESRRRAGEGKPETLDFLGFTHICGKKRNGRLTVVRQTSRQRVQAKLSEVKAELRRRLHDPIPQVGGWLRLVVGGHLRYYGVPMKSSAVHMFRHQMAWLSQRALARRSHTGRVSWERMQRLLDRWLPPAGICHPYPQRRLGVIPEVRAQCGNPARWDLWRGLWATIISTPTLFGVDRVTLFWGSIWHHVGREPSRFHLIFAPEADGERRWLTDPEQDRGG
jgi:hypothetical protein